jgi:hypothetical protein
MNSPKRKADKTKKPTSKSPFSAAPCQSRPISMHVLQRASNQLTTVNADCIKLLKRLTNFALRDSQIVRVKARGIIRWVRKQNGRDLHSDWKLQAGR